MNRYLIVFVVVLAMTGGVMLTAGDVERFDLGSIPGGDYNDTQRYETV